MALTQADIDRILGKQSIVDRVLQSNQPTISAQKGLSGEYGNYINNPNIPFNALRQGDVTGAAKLAANNLIAGLQSAQTPEGALNFVTHTPAIVGMHIPTFPSKPLPAGVGERFERTQAKELIPTKDLSAEDIRNASIFTFPADSTSYGLKTSSVSGNAISPEYQQISQGGIPFGRSVEHQSKDIGFASNEAAAKGQHSRYELEREANLKRGGSGRVFVSPTTMAQFSEGFSTQPVFMLDSMVKSQGLTPKDLSVIDDMVRKTRVGDKYPYKDWVGMADPKARDQLLTGEGVEAGKTDLRKKVYEKYASKTGQKTLDYNIEDLRGALLDPSLVNAPANNMGNLWYEVNFGKGITPSNIGSGHLDYSHDMGGNYRGTTVLQPTGKVFGSVYDNILNNIPKFDKNGKPIPESTRELNAINVLRSNKEGASLYVDDSNWERLKRLFQL